MQDTFSSKPIKTCSQCKIEQSIKMFPAKKHQCKTCQKQKRDSLKDEKRQYDLQYRSENKYKLSQQWKVYEQENKVAIRERKREYVKRRRVNDPIFRLRHNVSKSINQMLKSNGSSKKGESFLTHLPYTIQELKKHLEKQFDPWMTWANQGRYTRKIWKDDDQSTWGWQIDHIIPHSVFLYSTMTSQNFNDCWALCNLRPLSSKQNLIDGATKIRHEQNGTKNV